MPSAYNRCDTMQRSGVFSNSVDRSELDDPSCRLALDSAQFVTFLHPTRCLMMRLMTLTTNRREKRRFRSIWPITRVAGTLARAMWGCLLAWSLVLTPGSPANAADAPEAANQSAAAAVADANANTDSGDWNFPRGNAAASGATKTQLPDDLQVAWEFKADEAIESTPIVNGDRVFVADYAGKIYSLSRRDGKELWRKDFETGFSASPVFSAGLLVIGDYDGNVYALSADDGKELWRQSTGGEISGSAAIYEDKVLVACQDGKLYCFESATGKPVWTYAADDQIQCSPTIAGDRTFLGGCDAKLHIVDLKSGMSVGEGLPLDGPTGSTPAVQGELAVLPTHGGSVFGFDWKEKKELWRYEDELQGQEYRSSAAIAGNVAVVGSQRKQVDALDLKTGKRIWRYTLKRFADASPVIAGDDVWIPSTDGRLSRLSLADGTLKWSYEIRGGFAAGVAVTNNELFVADDDGIVRCFRGK